MSNILLAHPDMSDQALITSSNTIAGSMPLANLQTMQPRDRARFTNLSETIKIIIDLTSVFARGIYSQWNYIFLGFNNTDVNGVLKIRTAANVSSFAGSPLVASAWPSPGLKPDFPLIHSRVFYSTPQTNPAIEIEISNPTNAAGFIDIGRVYVSDAYVPGLPVSYGNMPNVSELERTTRAEGGSEYTRESGIDGSWDFAVQIDSDDTYAATEFYRRAMRIKRLRGTSKDIVVDFDPEDDEFAIDGIVYGRFTNMQPPRILAPFKYEVPMTVKGLR